jgi:hypothetical protein
MTSRSGVIAKKRQLTFLFLRWSGHECQLFDVAIDAMRIQSPEGIYLIDAERPNDSLFCFYTSHPKTPFKSIEETHG